MHKNRSSLISDGSKSVPRAEPTDSPATAAASYDVGADGPAEWNSATTCATSTTASTLWGWQAISALTGLIHLSGVSQHTSTSFHQGRGSTWRRRLALSGGIQIPTTRWGMSRCHQNQVCRAATLRTRQDLVGPFHCNAASWSYSYLGGIQDSLQGTSYTSWHHGPQAQWVSGLNSRKSHGTAICSSLQWYLSICWLLVLILECYTPRTKQHNC